jgi:hypothetical protein
VLQRFDESERLFYLTKIIIIFFSLSSILINRVQSKLSQLLSFNFVLSTENFRGENQQLDDAGPYYDLGPRPVTGKGTYYYMSTRNNNFTNRSQKAKIVVI